MMDDVAEPRRRLHLRVISCAKAQGGDEIVTSQQPLTEARRIHTQHDDLRCNVNNNIALLGQGQPSQLIDVVRYSVYKYHNTATTTIPHYRSPSLIHYSYVEIQSISRGGQCSRTHCVTYLINYI